MCIRQPGALEAEARDLIGRGGLFARQLYHLSEPYTDKTSIALRDGPMRSFVFRCGRGCKTSPTTEHGARKLYNTNCVETAMEGWV
jgi:hypothetical protein